MDHTFRCLNLLQSFVLLYACCGIEKLIRYIVVLAVGHKMYIFGKGFIRSPVNNQTARYYTFEFCIDFCYLLYCYIDQTSKINGCVYSKWLWLFKSLTILFSLQAGTPTNSKLENASKEDLIKLLKRQQLLLKKANAKDEADKALLKEKMSSLTEELELHQSQVCCNLISI